MIGSRTGKKEAPAETRSAGALNFSYKLPLQP